MISKQLDAPEAKKRIQDVAEISYDLGACISEGITDALNAALAASTNIEPFSGWLFFGIIFLCCLPAYNTATAE